ncbi:MAG: porphobilinogen synthase, partial [Chloroflexi bacterium]|nr:porphobilinogen synthase [Chloroflexota bacterium]
MTEFPQTRLRRFRRTEALRRMVRETRLAVDDLVYPLFVIHGRGVKNEIPSMPGVFQFSADKLSKEVEEIAGLGIPAVLLFGIPDAKDELGSSGYDPRG